MSLDRALSKTTLWYESFLVHPLIPKQANRYDHIVGFLNMIKNRFEYLQNHRNLEISSALLKHSEGIHTSVLFHGYRYRFKNHAV